MGTSFTEEVTFELSSKGSRDDAFQTEESAQAQRCEKQWAVCSSQGPAWWSKQDTMSVWCQRSMRTAKAWEVSAEVLWMPSVFFSPFWEECWPGNPDLTKPVSLSLLGLCVGGDTHVLSFFGFWFLDVMIFIFFFEVKLMYLVTWYFYTLQNYHHNKSSYHLSLYKVITVLLIIFPVLYITSLWLNLFCKWKLIPFPFHPFCYHFPHCRYHKPPDCSL